MENKLLNYQEAMAEITKVGQRLYQRDLLAGADGNISCRLSDGTILITGSGVSKGFLTSGDFARLTLDGQVKEGNPSTEKIMHLEIFRRSPEANFVIHAHPPTAIAWTMARPDLKELNNNCMSEVILAMGKIPVVPFSLPGTQEMADVLIPFLPKQQVFILARHGALAFGQTGQEALNGIERIEHVAKILLMAHQLGGVTELDQKSLDYLWEKRKMIGDKLI